MNRMRSIRWTVSILVLSTATLTGCEVITAVDEGKLPERTTNAGGGGAAGTAGAGGIGGAGGAGGAQ